MGATDGLLTNDSTEGYDDADLALLNRAWDSLPISVADGTDIAVKSQDHIAGDCSTASTAACARRTG
jgi:hypothetical protein